MSGRQIVEYRLRRPEREYLEAIVRDGQMIQRVANRARALLALERGEQAATIGAWTGLSRMGLWHLWQRYCVRGVRAIYDAERSGRPPELSPPPAGSDRTDRVYRAVRLRAPSDALGLSEPGHGGG